MRKLNLFLTAAIAFVFITHATLSGAALAGLGYIPQKTVARACLTLVILHAALSTVLLFKTLNAQRLSGAGYLRVNGLFWARRISGFLILLFVAFHLLVFMRGGEPETFGIGRLVLQIFLVVSVAIHMLTNIVPALTSLGVRGIKRAAPLVTIALSVLMLLFSAAFCIYFFHFAN